MDRVRAELNLEVSGRPAKSTSAIVDKLRRSSMRLTQMQDIAGCRIAVPGIAEQNWLVDELVLMFNMGIVDRRSRPSSGYRAVHIIVRSSPLPVEIQIRTELQHLWAELSEKLADRFGFELKYGGGPEAMRRILIELSDSIHQIETRTDVPSFSVEDKVIVKQQIRLAMLNVSIALKKEP